MKKHYLFFATIISILFLSSCVSRQEKINIQMDKLLLEVSNWNIQNFKSAEMRTKNFNVKLTIDKADVVRVTFWSYDHSYKNIMFYKHYAADDWYLYVDYSSSKTTERRSVRTILKDLKEI